MKFFIALSIFVSSMAFAQSNGYYDEFTLHMEKAWSPKWNLKTVTNEALKYESLTDFRIKAQGAYAWAKRNNCFDNITSHLQKEEWSSEKIINLSKKYKSLEEFRTGKDRRAYILMKQYGVTKEMLNLKTKKYKCKHCLKENIDAGNYTKYHGDSCKSKR